MKSDSKQEKIRNIQTDISDACNVFSTIWLRCTISTYHGANWIILDSRRSLLLGFRCFLVMLYLTYKIFK